MDTADRIRLPEQKKRRESWAVKHRVFIAVTAYGFAVVQHRIWFVVLCEPETLVALSESKGDLSSDHPEHEGAALDVRSASKE